MTVTATKVKFYNSGDTLVYNADAFMLAEGSMLDALIQQLPGVELKDDGRIFVNGKYVESLLLNGRQFMDNNNRLLLDNLGAYTVKDIAVYDKLSDRSLFLGQDKDNGETRYVMDVRMKKEFMGSYIANVEAGYGSADRYLGRFFLSRSDTRTQYVLFGNINNLNDRRRPGQSSNWTPEDLESGLRREKTIGGQYEVTQSGSNPWKFNGNFSLNHTSQDDETFTDRTNFLPGGNTYNYTFNNLRNRNLNFNTFHSTHKQTRRIFFSAKVSGRINRSDYRQSVVSGTFADRQESVTRQWLADIYATGSEATLSSIINRSIQTDSMRNNLWSVNGDASITYKFSQNPDNMYIWVKGGYTGQTPDRYNDQRINFGSSPAAERTMQIFRNHPAHEYYIKPIFSYCYNFSDNGNIQPEYTFTYTHRRNDSRLFNPEDPAADMTFDAPMSLDQANSYYQLDKTLTHTVGFRSSQVFRGDGHFWRIMLYSTLGFNTQHLDYTQAGQAIRKTRHSMQFTDSWTEVKYGFGAYSNRWGGKDYRNMLILKFESQAQMPDMRYLVDIPNTSDPLTILLGAPSLKNQHDLQWKLRYELTPQNGRIMEAAQIYYRLLTNALVRGYSYDTRTGVRTIRSYNTSGNWETGAMNSFMLPLDKAPQADTGGHKRGEIRPCHRRDRHRRRGAGAVHRQKPRGKPAATPHMGCRRMAQPHRQSQPAAAPHKLRTTRLQQHRRIRRQLRRGGHSEIHQELLAVDRHDALHPKRLRHSGDEQLRLGVERPPCSTLSTAAGAPSYSTASTCSVSSTRCNMQSTHRDAPSDMSTRFRDSSFSTHSIR